MSMFAGAKDKRFAELFFGMAENDALAAGALVLLFQNLPGAVTQIDEIDRLEGENDRLFREHLELSASVFIPRIDQELSERLIAELDDVTDALKGTVIKIGSYRIGEIRPEAIEFAEIIRQMAEQARLLIVEIGKPDIGRINQLVPDVKHLEEKADQLLRKARARLFDEVDSALADAIEKKEKSESAILTVLMKMDERAKWIDIFEGLEDVTDRFDHVAEVVSTIVRKLGKD
jgi:uncharacterized protein Yka (UPF0111/DUF47 family)